MVDTVSITDLQNAKLDTDHIADIATSLSATATDRLGTTKKTLQGAIASIAAIDVKGAWATTTGYVVKDAVLESGTWYICLITHTSGTFATDLAAGKWSILQGITDANLLNYAARKLDYVADMKAMTNPQAGEIIMLKDYANGNGAGVMFFETKSGTGTDDGGSVINHDTLAFRFEQIFGDVISVKQFGAVENSDNTSLINTIISTLDTADSGRGLEIDIPRYCNFYLDQLTLGQRQTLTYWIDDDKSTTQSSTKATNERVRFIANANANGIVNEDQIVGPYHPGQIVSVRKDVSGHDSYLGAGQSRLNPARASYNIRDEQQTVYRTVYENYATTSSIFAGTRQQGFGYRVTINGVGSSSFTTPPVKGDIIEGVDSGTIGILYSIDTNSMVVVWTYKKFQVGERLNDGDETTTDTITSTSVSTLSFTGLHTGRTEGNWTFGLPPDNDNLNPYILGIGGKSVASLPRTAGQNIPAEMSLTETGFAFVDHLELATPNGFELVYDTSPAAASRRIELKKFGDSTAQSAIGLHRASTTISSSLIASFSALNVASITNPSTGNYTITFTNEFARADYRVQHSLRKISTGMNDVEVQVFSKTAGSCTLRVYTRSTGNLVDLDADHQIDFDCFGGDI